MLSISYLKSLYILEDQTYKLFSAHGVSISQPTGISYLSVRRNLTQSDLVSGGVLQQHWYWKADYNSREFHVNSVNSREILQIFYAQHVDTRGVATSDIRDVLHVFSCVFQICRFKLNFQCQLHPPHGGEVHLQGLAAVGEDVEGDLGPLALEVRDELLQDLDLVHLGADLGDLALVLQLLHQGAAVLDQSEVSTGRGSPPITAHLDDEGRDGQEGEQQHVHHVQPLACGPER